MYLLSILWIVHPQPVLMVGGLRIYISLLDLCLTAGLLRASEVFDGVKDDEAEAFIRPKVTWVAPK